LLQDHPLLTWASYRDKFLDESLRLAGCGSVLEETTHCPGCQQDVPATFRCRECVGQEMICKECMCARHLRMPLHMIEVWNGEFFARTTLEQLGICVQLGHPPGITCAYRFSPRKSFTVLHTNGIHKVDLYFCGCSGVEQWTQLRRFGWWPATPLEPQTAATSQVLKQFHLLSLQGKVTGFNYYRALELQTDNTGLLHLPDRLSSFMNIIRQYRHIQMMKRAGRGHAIDGIGGTQPGECAVLCPACPQPGLNLSDDWVDAPASEQWIYRRIIAMDANFRLKNKLRSSAANDPGFHTGLAYFVPEEGYNEHVSNYATQEEVRLLSRCSGFAAIAKANTKNTKGLRATGVGAVSCAKHEYWLPNGLGDLQKGERYCNMDYIFWSSLRGMQNTALLVSYDIACQWSKNVWERMEEAPPELQIRLDHVAVDFAIPKFHLPAHGGPCQVPYSFNYKTGVGMTDGESPERNWASLNGAANSTKEMGPGARHDTLDDHCGHANWRRVVKTGASNWTSIVRRMKAAVLNTTEQVEIFEEFTGKLIAEREEQVPGWITLVEAWDAGDHSENPYECDNESSTISEERLRLAQEEAEHEAAGTLDSAGPGRSAFLLLAMDIEDLQCVHCCQRRLEADVTALQQAQTQEARSSLLRLIFKFRTEQEARMPNIGEQYEIDDTLLSATPEKIKLYLPSDLPSEIRNRHCSAELSNIEGRLRYAQACDALDELRRHLRIRTYLNQYKLKNITGQHANTRARGLQARVDQKVRAAAARYRRCRVAYFSLVGPGDWEFRLQVLNDEDIRGLGERGVRDRELSEIELTRNWNNPERIEEGGLNPGESTRVISWLWFAVGLSADSTDPGLHNALRVEWAKARARAKRWHEEVRRIQHEMLNILRYCSTLSRRWTLARRTRAAAVDQEQYQARVPDRALAEGLQAFALRQAHMFEQLRRSFNDQWTFIRRDAEVFLSAHPRVRYPDGVAA
ncbi:hypothetical protein BV25DRAFT_1810998, partial [Artomyces pyxidatus]